MKTEWKRIMTYMMMAVLLAGVVPTAARADLWDTTRNETVLQSAVARGKIGRNMNVTVTIHNYEPEGSGNTWKDVYVMLENSDATSGYLISPDNTEGWQVFPFERTAGQSVSGSCR